MDLTRDVLTPHEVAETLQITPDTVYRSIREGRLVASKLGRHYRITKETVELFLLVTATFGGARMRTYTGEEIAAWIEEDEIDDGTRDAGTGLLEDLRTKPS